jgi:radical SAM family uncharacterized protein
LVCRFSDATVSEMLHRVRKPGRYFDNEINFPDKVEGRLKFLVCFPDLYEIGMSHLGIRILYHIINGHPDFMADLAFAPWTDMEEFMRARSRPLYGIGSGLTAGAFDVIGFSLQHELQYTNVLGMLDLSGIALHSGGRRDGDPIIVAGGPCAFNPAPMAAFMDAFAIGDGETVCLEISRAVLEAREGGLTRSRTLERLAGLEGVYVPSVHGLKPGPESILRRVEKELRDDHFPTKPIVPLIPITHDRLSVEIMRGCTRGCRFCSAGMTGRPVRQRSIDSIVGLAEAGIEASGWEEVSLVSLSTSDYCDLKTLVARLAGALGKKHVSISLPSMRPGTFTEEIAEIVGGLRKTGLTFAPEAGSARLRQTINKNVDENELYSTVETAFRNEWESMKLYFMLGLPGEGPDDVEALIRMVRGVEAICRGYGRRKRVTVSVSPFVPRPHTPLQWEAQEPAEGIMAKLSTIKRKLPGGRIKIKWRDPWVSVLEGLLARGGAEFSDCILAAYRAGARFDGWTDSFDFGVWKRAVEESGIDAAGALSARPMAVPLPWQHIGAGVSLEFLKRECRKAGSGETTVDCREGSCSGCGACGDEPRPGPAASAATQAVADRADRLERPGSGGRARAVRAPAGAGRPGGRGEVRAPVVSMRFRVKFAKLGPMRLTSHLDVTRAVQRAMRRSGVPVTYSRGFSPHPRIAFGPPLPLGETGEGEYFDVLLAEAPGTGWLDLLNECLPRGLEVLEASLIEKSARSLMSDISAATYSIVLWSEDERLLSEQVRTLHGAMATGGNLIDFRAGGADNGRVEIEATVRLRGKGTRPDRILAEHLKSGRLRSKVIRKALFVERAGALYAPLTGFRARVR